jgi:hypothetical protein
MPPSLRKPTDWRTSAALSNDPSDRRNLGLIRPFAVGHICGEVTVQHVGDDPEAVVAVLGNLVHAQPNEVDAIDLHQPTNATFAHIGPSLYKRPKSP